jgi:hypothetical protein
MLPHPDVHRALTAERARELHAAAVRPRPIRTERPGGSARVLQALGGAFELVRRRRRLRLAYRRA